jgi:transposase
MEGAPAVTIVADEYDHVIGVDTHSKTHTYAILDAGTGRTVDTPDVPDDQSGSCPGGWVDQPSRARHEGGRG